MKLACLVVPVLVITGCGVSVTHTTLGPNLYAIDADGTNVSEEDAIAEADAYARQLCPAGYQVVGESSSERRYDGRPTFQPGPRSSHAHMRVACAAPPPTQCASGPGSCTHSQR